MDDHALRVLEYDTLLTGIAGGTAGPDGRDLVLALRPVQRREDAEARLELFGAGLSVLGAGDEFPDRTVPDLRDILRMVAPAGAVLAGDELVACLRVLEAAERMGAFLLGERCARHPSLVCIGREFDPRAELAARLRRALDDNGEVLDDASPRLRTIRVSIRHLERRIERRLDDLLRDSALAGVLQEKFVTRRNGRFVVPVRRDERSGLPGVVHDHSNSGMTLFVEPTATLPLGNELAGACLEERDEVLRVLAELSAGVRDAADAIRRNAAALARIDMTVAVGRWAVRHGCVLPEFGTAMRILDARHPLLEDSLRNEGRGGEVVPLDLEVPASLKTLVITGSNTGGKTVALKTVGLLALMARTGLPVPVHPDSRFEWFDKVFADIGDEQSLEASLSTFSGHLQQINRILRDETEGRALVLLDELGAGTDPLEGGALACAVLAELARRDALTVATTHLGVVKTFVHEAPGMWNAAVRFDTDTLRPQYSLDVGRPGASHALLIARRLGVPANVLAGAERMLSADHLKLESMLAKMEEDQRRIASREREVSGITDELVRDRAEIKAELEKLKRERKQLLHDAYRQAAAIVDNTRREMERKLEAIALAARGAPETVKTVRREIADAEQKLSRSIRHTSPKPKRPVDPRTLTPGTRVRVLKLNEDGVIVSVSDGDRRAVVEVGGLRVNVEVRELGRAETGASEAEKVVRVQRPRVQGRTSHEVNLIGLRVDEAVDRLDAFLDRACLSGIEEVRVVHGFGTGALQRGLHDWLRSRAGVASYRLGRQAEDPGGGGVTIVQLE